MIVFVQVRVTTVGPVCIYHCSRTLIYKVGCHNPKLVGRKYCFIQSYCFLSEQIGTMSESSRRLDNGALDGLRAIAVIHVMVRLFMSV